MKVYGKPLVYLDNAGVGTEAECGAGPHDARPTSPNTPTCIAACIISPMPRPRVMRGPRAGGEVPQRQAQ